MAEAVKLYQKIGFPALQKGSHDKKLIGYFQADIGTINQIVHLWKFDDDADRRAHWVAVYANKEFVEGFASKFRPLLMTQEVKLLQAAPWGLVPDFERGWREAQLHGLAFLSFRHALPPYGRVVCLRMTRFRTTGKAVERAMPLRRPGGQ
jgi:hypothetical protein